jgi:hypothetical protein
MFDELQSLFEDAQLRALLAHYARAGAADPQVWQDRVMQMDGVRAEDLVKLHGELIAYEWITQNTGVLPAPRVGELPQCYRVTAAGLRALRQAQGAPAERESA